MCGDPGGMDVDVDVDVDVDEHGHGHGHDGSQRMMASRW